MAGNAVGLGNFLRFPVQAMENGGGAFIIPYLVCFLVLGIPLLWIEWATGRFGGRFGDHSTPYILDNLGKRRYWKYIGVFGVFTNIGVAAYYVYIESWTLSYVFKSLFGAFDGESREAVAGMFAEYVDPTAWESGLPLIAFVISIALNTYVLSRGLKGGIELVARWGVPLLLLFGVLLAVRGWTLGNSAATADCPDCNAFLGLNFLWAPKFTSLADPTVWLAAAGQIFFTLSVGMGTIHCYASYLRKRDDIALNAMSAGWMNGFVEIVLGSAVVVPLAAGYLGFDWVRENIGFSTAFETMPYLFERFGEQTVGFLGNLGGAVWFGLLFIAGVTSSLAMGTPWMGFVQDEFKWSRNKAALTFGIIILVMGLPTVFFFSKGVFDEYDFWTGTFTIVTFAVLETVLFVWIFGMRRGWPEIIGGADIKIPTVYKYIMVSLTPVLLIVLFVAALFKPVNNDWGAALGNLTAGKAWELDGSSVIGKVMNKDIVANAAWFSDIYETPKAGTVTAIQKEGATTTVVISDTVPYYTSEYGNPLKFKPKDFTQREGQYYDGARLIEPYDSFVAVWSLAFPPEAVVTVKVNQRVQKAAAIANWPHANHVFYTDLARIYLLLLFIGLAVLVRVAYGIRKREGRLTPQEKLEYIDE